jgi:hypothetical protein
MLPRTDDRKTGGQLVTAPDVVHQRLLGRMVGQTSIIDGDTLEIDGTRGRLWGSDAPESTQFCRGEDSLPYPKRGKFCERCPMSAIEFPFESNQDVIAKSERGQFPAKVFSLVHQFGGLDFVVVVDSNGGTHHKFFRELEAAAPIL